jgi:hypothetical protein
VAVGETLKGRLWSWPFSLLEQILDAGSPFARMARLGLERSTHAARSRLARAGELQSLGTGMGFQARARGDLELVEQVDEDAQPFLAVRLSPRAHDVVRDRVSGFVQGRADFVVTRAQLDDVVTNLISGVGTL